MKIKRDFGLSKITSSSTNTWFNHYPHVVIKQFFHYSITEGEREILDYLYHDTKSKTSRHSQLRRRLRNRQQREF